jgi:hypothetical protein
MTEVEQLKKRIRDLSLGQLARFRAWFIEFDAQVWDRQIEADLEAGKLDRLIEEARADYDKIAE